MTNFWFDITDALGVPTTVWIDDYIAFKENEWTGESGLFYAQVGADNALWGALIEKALAKSVGNFWHLDTGINADGVVELLAPELPATCKYQAGGVLVPSGCIYFAPCSARLALCMNAN